MRALQNLRNVGHKIAVDREYADQLYSDGMDYVSKRRKREAVSLANKFRRKVKEHIVSRKTQDIDALKAWQETFENNRSEDDLSIPEAIEIDKITVKPKPPLKTPYKTQSRTYRDYGFMQGVWTPTGARNDSFHDEYAKAQRSGKKYY